MQQVSQVRTVARRAPRKPVRVRTTLYEVIETVRNELQVDDEQKIAAVVLHLLDKGRIRFMGDCLDVEFSRN